MRKIEIEARSGFINGTLNFIKGTDVPVFKARINGELLDVVSINDLQSYGK